jgi:type III restriction enzyme
LNRGIASVFYDELSKKWDIDLNQALVDLEGDDTFPRRAITKVSNCYNFKTCQSVVLTHSDPEFKFVKALTQPKNAEKIKAWFKSPDTGFYKIEYAYASGGGDYTRRGEFNPDFFVLLDREIVVVEIKGDEEINEPSSENRGKRRAAIEHFELLNKLQAGVKYHFCFLSPEYYDHFFAQLQKGSMMNFQSRLDVALS